MPNPPTEISKKEGEVYNLYVQVHALGLSVRKAIDSVTFKRATLYAWKRDYPGWVETIEERAIADAQALRAQTAAQIVIQKLHAQAQVEEAILGETGNIVQRLLGIAVDSEDEKASIRAAALLRDWLRDGFAFERDDHARPVEPEPDVLAFDPHTTQIDLTNIRTRSGEKLTITIENESQVDLVDVTPQSQQPRICP